MIENFDIKYYPEINDRVETHLEYTLYFTNASGKTSWKDGNVQFCHCSAGELFYYVMQYQTEFVRQNLIRLEVMIPNRNQFGNLVAGKIKETGLLLAIRKEA